ncbi:hypothetical protein BpHYR1_045043 [Brachionus plicatilis]|uniref:Uncharacterized protein n=1 Tax=Brachionus plicatilis TaxID=10195 RepID=A0A3M7QLE3_BRAPC|nr:hypothetical protein BpHYR1_045043 [Brachionus plicatilis]
MDSFSLDVLVKTPLAPSLHSFDLDPFSLQMVKRRLITNNAVTIMAIIQETTTKEMRITIKVLLLAAVLNEALRDIPTTLPELLTIKLFSFLENMVKLWFVKSVLINARFICGLEDMVSLLIELINLETNFK